VLIGLAFKQLFLADSKLRLTEIAIPAIASFGILGVTAIALIYHIFGYHSGRSIAITAAILGSFILYSQRKSRTATQELSVSNLQPWQWLVFVVCVGIQLWGDTDQAQIGYWTSGNFLTLDWLIFPELRAYGFTYTVSPIFDKPSLLLTALMLSDFPNSLEARFAFLAFGIPMISGILSGCLVIASIAFFKRITDSQVGPLLAVIFLICVLGPKIFSVRAESISMIPGFLGIVLLYDLLFKSSTRRIRYGISAAVMFAISITIHGIAGISVGLIASGLVLWKLIFGNNRSVTATSALFVATIALATVGCLSMIYELPASTTLSSEVMKAENLRIGDPDPAVAYRNAYRMDKNKWVPHISSPPHVSLAENLLDNINTILEPDTRMLKRYFSAPWISIWALILTTVVFVGIFRVILNYRTNGKVDRYFFRSIKRATTTTITSPFAISMVALFLSIAAVSIYFNYTSYYSYPYSTYTQRLSPYQSAAFICFTVYYIWNVIWYDSHQLTNAYRTESIIIVLTLSLIMLGASNMARQNRTTNLENFDGLLSDILHALYDEGTDRERKIFINAYTEGGYTYLTRSDVITEGASRYQFPGFMVKSTERLERYNTFLRKPTCRFLQEEKVSHLVLISPNNKEKATAASERLSRTNYDAIHRLPGINRVRGNKRYELLLFNQSACDVESKDKLPIAVSDLR